MKNKISALIFLFSLAIGLVSVPEPCSGIWVKYEDGFRCEARPEKFCGGRVE